MQKYLMEFLGTFFLVLTIAVSGHPLAIGAILAALVFVGSGISGGHYNPAVTLAVFLKKGMTGKPTLMYMLVQLLGALAAVGISQLGLGVQFLPSQGETISLTLAILFEVLMTALLALVVLRATVVKETGFAAAAIGLAILAGIYVAGPVSGGVLNPAVGLSSMLVNMQTFTQHGASAVMFLSTYLLAPLAGGLLASLLSRPLFRDQ